MTFTNVPTPKSRTIPHVEINWYDYQVTHTESYGPTPKATGRFNLITRRICSATTNPLNPNTYSLTLFDVACVDTGAQISVSGRRQAEAYCKAVNISLVLLTSKMNFKFGNVVSPIRCAMPFRFPSPDGGSLEMDIDIFDLDIPLSLGLRQLLLHMLLVNYLSNKMTCEQLDWIVNLNDK